MSTYTQLLYQIVFSTKDRKHTLTDDHRIALYQYISGILKNKNCHLYQIGGVADHIHIVLHIHPSVALASIVKDIKLASIKQIKEQGLFKEFNGWQDGYGAFTYSIKEKDRLIEYVKNQEEHHRRKTYKEELVQLLKEHEVAFDDKFLL